MQIVADKALNRKSDLTTRFARGTEDTELQSEKGKINNLFLPQMHADERR
jgi:hypothetical protein